MQNSVANVNFYPFPEQTVVIMNWDGVIQLLTMLMSLTHGGGGGGGGEGGYSSKL